MKKNTDFESIYGPQCASDHDFTAKSRMLQSIWRVENSIKMGVGPNRNSVDKDGLPSKYGNMIDSGETNGKNFYYSQTFEYAKWRASKKLKGETIDEYRLMNNLMSSMPMAFNFFHPLMMLKMTNPEALDSIIQSVFSGLPVEIFKVKQVGLEFIPLPITKYTGDNSAMDAFVLFWDKRGNEYLIAIEVKYTDSLGINTASKNEVVEKQLELFRELDVLTEEGIKLLVSKKVALSQIYRNFLLAEKFGAVHELKDVYSVVIAPKDHPSTEILSLQKSLKKKEKIRAIKWEEVVKDAKRLCPAEYINWLNWFEARYLDFGKIKQYL
ncbi:MAG TPA: hypothetical protein VFP20_00075 [Bacteroidales bacterium]|nr:hypothetical protein [Bacteroidales bacterium]